MKLNMSVTPPKLDVINRHPVELGNVYLFRGSNAQSPKTKEGGAESVAIVIYKTAKQASIAAFSLDGSLRSVYTRSIKELEKQKPAGTSSSFAAMNIEINWNS